MLIVGPANTTTELIKNIHHHDPKLMQVTSGIVTVDHPSDGAVVAAGARRGTFTHLDGTTSTIADVDFEVNQFITVYLGNTAIDASIAATMPNSPVTAHCPTCPWC